MIPGSELAMLGGAWPYRTATNEAGMTAPLVGIVMGSASDWETMQHAVGRLKEFEVPCEARVISAHRSPALAHRYATEAAGRGLACVIAAALGLVALFVRFSSRSFDAVRDKTWPRECAAVLVLALLLSPMTWQQHLAWLVPGAFVVLTAAVRNQLKTRAWVLLGIYVVLVMVLNYEVLGKPRFQMFLSYHPFGIAMILLFGLIVGLGSKTSPIAIAKHTSSQ